MKTKLLVISLFLAFCGITNEVVAQSNVFHRSEVLTGNWWDDANPWNRASDNWNIRRPDVGAGFWALPPQEAGTHVATRNFVFIGHNSQTTMSVNGAFFQLKSLTLQSGATFARTFNEAAGGGISIDTGILNESAGTHTFNVPIGVDGPSVAFDAIHSAGSMVFNRSIFLNPNTAIFRGPGAITVNGDIIHTGNIVKEGTGTLTLTGANTYTGTTTLNAGTLALNRTGGATLPATNSVVVNGGTLRIQTPQTLASITVAATGAVVIEAGGSLVVTGTFTNLGSLTNNAGAGGLVLRSGASMIHNTAGVEATMERFFADSVRWRLVSSPVASQAISGPWIPATPNHGYDFYDWREETATWRNQKVPGNNITHFVPGVGYLISFQSADLTQSFAGALNNGDITVPVTRLNTGAHRGANLLGNPYPSSIDWNRAVRTLFVDDFAYLYDPLAGGGGGSYVPVNGFNPGALIAPNQGFFVIKAAAGTNSFTFTNTMRVHEGVFRSAAADPTITITLQQGEFYDRAQIVQLQDATTARERSDALKFFSYNPLMPQVFSMSSDAVQLAVNSTGPITEDASFTIGVLTPVTGTYTLQVEGLQEMLAGRPAFLLDKVTGTSHNLRDQTGISFHAVQSNTTVERFVLSFVLSLIHI